MLGGMLVRILFAVILVLATWNPAGVSYVQWALIDTSSFDATKALVGVVLLAAWILCVRATWVSLGLMGVVLAAVVIGVFVWWLVRSASSRPTSARSRGSCSWRSASCSGSGWVGRSCGRRRPGRSRPTERSPGI